MLGCNIQFDSIQNHHSRPEFSLNKDITSHRNTQGSISDNKLTRVEGFFYSLAFSGLVSLNIVSFSSKFGGNQYNE